MKSTVASTSAYSYDQQCCSSDCDYEPESGLISRTQHARTAMGMPPALHDAQAPSATLADLGLAIYIINFFGVSSASGRPRYWLLLLWMLVFCGAVAASEAAVRRLGRQMHASHVASPIAGGVGVCAGFVIGVFCIQVLHQWQTPQDEPADPTAWRLRAQARRRKVVSARVLHRADHRASHLASAAASSAQLSPSRSESGQLIEASDIPSDLSSNDHGYGPPFAGFFRLPGSGTLLLNEIVALVVPSDARRVFTMFASVMACMIGLLAFPLLYLSDVFYLEDRDTTYGEATVIVLARMLSAVLPLVPIIGIVSAMFGAPLAFVLRIRAIVDEIRLRTPLDHARHGLADLTYEIGAVYELVELMNARMSAIVGVSTLALLVGVGGQLLYFLTSESRRLSAVLSLASFLLMFIVGISPFAVLNTQLGRMQTAVLIERGEIAVTEGIDAGRLEALVSEFDSLLQFTTAFRGGAKVGGVLVTIGLMKAIVIGAVSFVSAITTFVE